MFLDVQLITVKAYGGRRYTSKRQLVLERAQKIRGKFYLFLLYDVRSGSTHWAFLPGKNSTYVRRFMHQLRNWYKDQEVWVALDQDRSHPCKSRETRRTMRALQLHWISLPKASPDDNPVETLFSDIQSMILDNSDDPDVKATQQRISQHLRNRNRRKDRQIRIPYLPLIHKN